MIHILHHQKDEIIGWISRVKQDSHKNSIQNEESYDFIASVNELAIDKISSRSRILIQGEEGDFREFIVDYIHERTASMEKQVYTKGSFYDIRKLKIIKPQTLDAQTIQTAAGLVLYGLPWEVGIVEYSGIRKWVIDKHLDAYEALKAIASLFECEIRFRVKVNGDTITGRYVDFIKRQGLNRGKETVFGKDLINITRKVLPERIVTALHCLGPEKQDGTRLEVIVTDDAAYQNWNWKGHHLIEKYEPESSDQDMTMERLTQLGEAELKKRITAAVEYEVDAASLEHIYGYEHEIVRLGDGDRIKDEHFNPPMYLDSRVIFVDRSVFVESRKTFKLGEVIEYKKEDVMKTWRDLQDLYATKVIKSPTPPVGKPNVIWIKNGGSSEVAYTWDVGLQKWIALSGSYTWYMFADDASGANMSSNPTGKKYIGISYNQTEETPSLDPTDYTWALFQGPQGVQGPTGDDGQPTFTWVKYADDSNGTNMSDDSTGKKYIGFATNKSTIVEGNNPADYTWTLIQGPKGDEGEPGQPGDDGQTSYFHTAWANNSTGTVGFSTTDPTGRTYIGTYTDFTVNDSNDPTKYTWALYQGPQGPTGDDGPQGPTGPQGIPGGHNLCENGHFEDDTVGQIPKYWQSGSAGIVESVGGSGSSKSLSTTANATTNRNSYVSNLISVTPGQKFYVTAEGRYLNTVGTGLGRIGFRRYSATKVALSNHDPVVTWNTKSVTYSTLNGVYTVPSGCYYLQIWVQFSTNGETTNKFYIDNIHVNRMIGEELIIPGSITVDHIKSLLGLNINDKFIVDDQGNPYFAGELVGASGTFTGKISTVGANGKVTIENDTIKSENGDWYVMMTGHQLEAFIGAFTSAKINGNGLFIKTIDEDQKGGSVTGSVTNGVTHIDIYADNYVRFLAYGSEKARVIDTGIALEDNCIISTADRGWIAPTLLNGVTNQGGGLRTIGFYRDALGYVRIRGFLKGVTDGKHIFTLPVGYRPNEAETINCWSNNSVGSGRVTVNTDGRVIATISGDWLAFSYGLFMAEQ
ncbi:hypothetical protein AF332_07140 [Sporosarcina globispora]|uniref:Tail spike domain-containing protein n=1 Tax=Sporosarcina globispora TaxID=1459 RepID=A0A0M0G9V5_SPOGL|nr:phage tail spike protein [Sporosarcina globispora]KON86614.1 hypothetical protein AF332_07140 [Sporosarcina globispora]